MKLKPHNPYNTTDKEGRAHFALRMKHKTHKPFKTPDKEGRAHVALRMKLKTHKPHKTAEKKGARKKARAKGRAQKASATLPPPPNHPLNINNAMM